MDTTLELARLWRKAQHVVALTGAGLSTASGIPDFRSPGGRWERYRPTSIQDFLAHESAREEYWRYKGETWEVIQQAQPNPAHLALSRLAQLERLHLLVTQNVDGLHERSAFPPERLVNIHGSDMRVVCVECGAEEPRETAQRAWAGGVAVPRCTCGGAWKPATISFGQALVSEHLDRAMQEAGRCDLFVAAGTSLVVGPINQMFDVARSAGATTVILTASETPYDADCDLRSTDPLEQVLPEVARQLMDA